MRLGYLLLLLILGLAPGLLFAETPTGKALGAPRFEKVSAEALSSAGFLPSQSRGVFIGVNDFDDDSVVDLKYACDDAVDLAFRFYELGLIRAEGISLGLSGTPMKPESAANLATLRERGMAEPFNPLRSEILKRVGAAARGSGKEGLLVLTLSTHGFYERGDALFARDTTADLDLDSGILTETSLSYDSLVQLMLRSPSPRRLALVDACRERLRQGGTKSIGRDPGLPNALAERLAQTKGIAMVLGAPPGGYGYDGGEDDTNQPIRNGVFTHYLLKGLAGEVQGESATGFVTLGALLDYTQSHLSRWTASNGRPLDDGGSGISFRELDRALMELPLAVDAGRAERLRDIEQRRVKARVLLAQSFAAEPNIVTAAILGEVTQALSEWDAERVEQLVLAIERLEAGTPESRRYFVKVDWDALRPASVTPTPTPFPTPAPTAAPTAAAVDLHTRTVAADGSTAYVTIASAMGESVAGDTVVVKPGVYRELVVLRSGVRLLGSGPDVTHVEIQSGQRSALLAADCRDAFVENISFDGVGHTNINAWSPGFSLAFRDGNMVVDTIDEGGPAASLGITSGSVVTRFAGREPLNGDQWPLPFEFGAATVTRGLDLEIIQDGVRKSYRVEPKLLPVVDPESKVTGLAILRSSVNLANVVVKEFSGDGFHIAGAESKVSARKVTVTGCGKHGMMVLQGAELFAEDCVLNENKSAGCFVSGTRTMADIRTLSASLNGSSGVFVRDGASASVLHGTIEQSGASGVRVIETGSRLTVKDCQILRNTKDGASATSGGELIVDYCIVEANLEEGVNAWTSGTRVTVINSNMRLNKNRGFYLSADAVGRMEGSLAHMNDKGGIRIGGTSDFAINDSNVTYNTGDGLSISSGSRVRLTKVGAEKNNEDGYAIWGEGTNVTLKECTSKTSTRYGFYLSDSATAEFANCVSSENAKSGFALSGKSTATLSDSQAISNPDDGFTIWGEAVATATGCLAKGSTTGYSAASGTVFTISQSVAEESTVRGFLAFGTNGRMVATDCKALSGAHGFAVGSGASGEFANCESTANKETGYFAYGEGTSITVRDSTAADSSYGIWLQGASSGTITGNTVTNCTDWGIGLTGEGTVAAVRDNTLTGNGNSDKVSVSMGARNSAE